MEDLINRLEKYTLFVTIFLFPLAVASISPNPFVVPKLAILTYGVLILLALFAIRTIATGKLSFSVGNFDFPVFLVGGAFLISTIIRTPNKMEAFLLPGTATASLGAVLLYFLINQRDEKEKQQLAGVIFTSSTIFSIITLLSFSGIFGKIPQLPSFVRTQNFTPEGGFLPAAVFLAVTLPIGIGIFLSLKNISSKAIWTVACAVVVLGLAVSIYNILPGRPLSPRFPSFGVSWNIAVDSLKDSPVFGVGPGNYLTAFNRFRPLSYNQTDLWAVRFGTGRNFYLTTLTEVGMLGIAGIILLVLTLYRNTQENLRQKANLNLGKISLLFSLILLTIILALVPGSLLLIVLFFILLAINTKTHKTFLSLTSQEVPSSAGVSGVLTSKAPALIITLPILVASLFLGYQSSRVLAAEYKFEKGLEALTRNEASTTYDAISQAIRINPRVDRYHLTFAQVNLALANAIATQAKNSQTNKPQISDQDRQNITTLIQQAISQAKAGVALNLLRAGNWEVLAQVYRAIMPLAQGADNFAIQSYRQAIALDPINPGSRIDLGGIYYGKGDFDTAIRVFELAVAAKPDYANAHYNLAFALRDKGEIDRAISEMTTVLSLLNRSSNDYEVARKALEDMQAKKKVEAQSGQEITAPQTAEEQLKPPIELPQGAEPPEAALTPTTTPLQQEEVSITPSISPSPSATP